LRTQRGGANGEWVGSGLWLTRNDPPPGGGRGEGKQPPGRDGGGRGSWFRKVRRVSSASGGLGPGARRGHAIALGPKGSPTPSPWGHTPLSRGSGSRPTWPWANFGGGKMACRGRGKVIGGQLRLEGPTCPGGMHESPDRTVWRTETETPKENIDSHGPHAPKGAFCGRRFPHGFGNVHGNHWPQPLSLCQQPHNRGR